MIVTNAVALSILTARIQIFHSDSTGSELVLVNDSKPQSQDPLAVAQKLSEMLTIGSMDWHRMKSNRKARALEQCAGAMVYLLKNQPEEALVRLQQAVGWLDKSISAPPCPTHGHAQNKIDQ